MSDVENDGRGKWQRLAWSDDVMAVMNDPEVAKLSAKDAADVLNKLFPSKFTDVGLAYTKNMVSQKRGRMGTSREQIRDMYDPAELMRLRAEGWTNAQIADKITKDTGREVSQKAIEMAFRRMRRPGEC